MDGFTAKDQIELCQLRIFRLSVSMAWTVSCGVAEKNAVAVGGAIV